MSPTMRAFRAQLSLGDFQVRCFNGPSTATGKPLRVIAMGSPRCWISERNARHLALNSVALTTRVFINLRSYYLSPRGPDFGKKLARGFLVGIVFEQLYHAGLRGRRIPGLELGHRQVHPHAGQSRVARKRVRPQPDRVARAAALD